MVDMYIYTISSNYRWWRFRIFLIFLKGTYHVLNIIAIIPLRSSLRTTGGSFSAEPSAGTVMCVMCIFLRDTMQTCMFIIGLFQKMFAETTGIHWSNSFWRRSAMIYWKPWPRGVFDIYSNMAYDAGRSDRTNTGYLFDPCSDSWFRYSAQHLRSWTEETV